MTFKNQSMYSIASDLIELGFKTSEKEVIKKTFGYSEDEIEKIIAEMQKQ